MRVLFTTTPGWGHVHPMIPLARAFIDRGDDVLWAAPPEFEAPLIGAGFQMREAGSGFSPGAKPPFDPKEVAALPERERSTFIFPRVFGMLAGAMLADLEPIIDSFKPDLLVREAAEFAGPLAAALHGVPSLTHAIGGLMPTHRVAAVSEQVADLWQERGLTAPPYAGSYEYLYLDIYPPSLQHADMDHVPFRQPLRPVAYATGSGDPLPDWPAEYSGQPLVYVTFGTAPGGSPVAIVLEALRDLSARIVVTVGPQGDPSLLGEQPANVRVARYIPQTELLGSCSAVVSHAGSGTFLGALAQGLPQLCLPSAADQFLNAEACATAGAGLTLMPDDVTPQSVRAAVEQLLGDEQLKSGALSVSTEIARMPRPTEVATILADQFGGENGNSH